jgi:pimeloyl-ACP methyl ester carboxylesterase
VIFRGLLLALRRPPRSRPNTQAATKLWSDPAVRPAILDDLREAVVQPGTRGLVQELALYATPWDFALEEIVVDVAIWHGARDVNVPTALASYIADAIPHAQLRVIDGEHLTPIEQIDHVVQTIRGSSDSPADSHQRLYEANRMKDTREASSLDAQ